MSEKEKLIELIDSINLDPIMDRALNIKWCQNKREERKRKRLKKKRGKLARRRHLNH